MVYIASVIKETYPFLPKELGNKLSRTMFPLSSLRHFRVRRLAFPPRRSIPPTHFFHPAAKLTRETDRKRSRMKEKEMKGRGKEEDEKRRSGYEKVDGLREIDVARDGRNVTGLRNVRRGSIFVHRSCK